MMKKIKNCAIIYIYTEWYFLFGCLREGTCDKMNEKNIRIIKEAENSKSVSWRAFGKFSFIAMVLILAVSGPVIGYSAYQNDSLGIRTQIEKLENEVASNTENVIEEPQISKEELSYMRKKKQEIASQKYEKSEPVVQEQVESSTLLMSDPFTGQTHEITEEEYHMACMVVEAEGESTGYTNKLEIAEVIRNRTFDARYKKDNLFEIFNQPGQFETVNKDGNVERSGKRFYWEDIPEETKEAVSTAFFKNSQTLPANALGWRGNGTRNEIVFE